MVSPALQGCRGWHGVGRAVQPIPKFPKTLFFTGRFYTRWMGDFSSLWALVSPFPFGDHFLSTYYVPDTILGTLYMKQ